MSARGNCYDNAVVESFFGLLKRERVNRTRYLTRDEAKADMFDYIERFYNRNAVMVILVISVQLRLRNETKTNFKRSIKPGSNQCALKRPLR